MAIARGGSYQLWVTEPSPTPHAIAPGNYTPAGFMPLGCITTYTDEVQQVEWEGRVLRGALVERCKEDCNINLNRLERWFYTAKFVLCFICNLTPQDRHRSRTGLLPDTVMVGATEGSFHTFSGYPDGGENASWEALNVGHGIFRNWFYEVAYDGWW